MKRNVIKTPFVIIFLIIIFVTNFSLIVIVNKNWDNSIGKYIPLQNEIKELKSNLAKAHLWLEESIASDESINIQKDVIIPFENKSFYDYFDTATKTLNSNEDHQYLLALQDIKQRLHPLLLLTQKRLAYRIGSDVDRQFDTDFTTILNKIDMLSVKIKNKITNEIKKLNDYFVVNIVIFLLMNILMFIILFFYRKKQLASELALFKEKEIALVTLRSIGDSVVTTDMYGKITFFNKMAEKITEYSMEEVEGLHVDEVLNLSNMKTGEKIVTPIYDVLYNNLTKLISNGTMLKSKSGKEYIISDSAAPLKNEDGEIFGTVLVFQDDTYEHKLYEEIKNQHLLLKTVLNSTPDLIFYKDYLNGDGKYIGCNRAFEAFMGKSNKEIVNHTDIELLGEELGEYFRTIDRDILALNKTVIREDEVKYPDGSKVLLSNSIAPYANNDGKTIGIVGISRDITKTYENNKKIAKLQERQALALIGNNDGLWDWNLKDDSVYFSPRWKEMLGYSDNELINEFSTWQERVHPDDFKTTLEDIQDNIDGKTKYYEGEHRLKHKDGSWVWILARAKTIFDKNGKAVRMTGTHTDITKEKATQLRYAQQAQMIEQTHDSVISLDLDGFVTSVNHAAEVLLGYIADEMIGKHARMFYLEEDYEKLYEGLELVIEKGNRHREIRIVKKSGEAIYADLSLSLLRDEKGKPTGMVGYLQDITKRKEAEENLVEQKNILNHQAHHDALTGLPNRILFQDRLNQTIEKAKRNNSKIALLFIDLDNFKEINDSLGHDIGDEVLKEIAIRLQKDIRDEDTLSRLGGDEFTIILGELHEASDASLISNKILKSLSKSMNINGHTLYVSCSIGISIYPDDGKLSQNLLKFADAAMYKAKDEGRNNFQYYNSTLTELAFERVVMETSLRVALKNEEFIVYYQPQVNGTTDTLIGMEALVRWQHPTMGLVSPDKFIPLAESIGLVVELDRYVMKTAMTQLSKWYKDGLNPGMLAMNLAAKQLQQTDFIPMLENLIKETKCKAQWIELEVTEGQIMTHPEEAIEILNKISDLDIQLAVDDFGTGYSSLAYLKRLPIDKLKIDQAFVRELPDSEEDSAIAKAVMVLAKSLNLKVIAEGVETKAQRDFMVENGCENIQGYFYSKPVPADELEKMLKGGI